MLEKSDNKVNDQERKKAEYTVRVRDYLTQVMQYRDCLTRYPKAPEPNTKLYAANMEFIVYCNDGSEVIPEQLCEAYQVIMTYRFPMRLNPLNAPKIEALPAEEKALLYRDEAEFILMKIRNINPAFCINTIPKSLYQLLFFIASETERQAAFKKNQSFFTTPNRDNYVSIENTPNDDDNNSVTNINRPVFGFGFHAKKAFTNPNDTDNYFQHCITYLGCHIVTQEWYNTNMFILELLVKRGLLGVDFSPNQLRGLSNWAYDFIANNTLLNRHRASFMSTVGSRCDLFNHEEKRNYLQDLANTLILREWNLRANNCHSIYRGGDEKKLTMNDPNDDYSYSFSDGLFGGLVYDCLTGMAFRYTRAGYCYIKDLSIEGFGQNSRDTSEVFLPPVPALAAALGHGEYHHPRTLFSQESFKRNKFSGLSFFCNNAKQIPSSLVPVLTSHNTTCAENNAACADLFKDVERVFLYDSRNRSRQCITIM